MKSLLSALLVAVSFAAPAFAASDVVTIYAADGLHDGKGSWFETQFDAFTKATGVKVQYVEAGSGGVVERVAKEKSNPQADVLVTLPPFIQRAEATGLLQPFKPAAADVIDGHAEHGAEVLKRNAHVARERRFDGLSDVGIDFEVLGFGVSETNAGLIQLRSLTLAVLFGILRNEANP